MSKVRRSFTREFKVRMVREIEAGKKPAEVAREHQLHPTMLSKWQREYRADPEEAFRKKTTSKRDDGRLAELERMIGQLTMENAFLKKVLVRLESSGGSRSQR